MDCLGLEGEIAEEWNHYIELLLNKLNYLDEESLNYLCWSKTPSTCHFTTKLGYKTCNESMHVSPKKWWWGISWKLNAPLKWKTTLSLDLNNKFLTWEIRSKRGWNNHNRCSLCKTSVDFVTHFHWLFLCNPSSEYYWGKVEAKGTVE